MTDAHALAPPRAGRRLTRTLRHGIDRNLWVLIVLAIAALAWTLLALTHSGIGHSPAGQAGPVEAPALDPSLTGHPQHGPAASGGSGTPAELALATGIIGAVGWAIMVVAMMLPLALPMLATVGKLVARWPDAYRFKVLAAMTFVAVWTLVGIVLIAGDLGIRALWTGQGWPPAQSQLVVGAVLIGAGLFQFSPVKDLCLRGCRSPRSFALAHWRGHRSPASEVVTMTGAYALSCVGCCWALMLIGFVVGTAALPVMVVLAVFMAAERLVPWGRRLVRPAGFGLVVLGTVTALDLSELLVL